MRRLRDAESFAKRPDESEGKREKHYRETCGLCGKDGMTEKDLFPLRTVGMDGNLTPIQWAHNTCRRPTMKSARKVDSWARGETTHPDAMYASAIGAAIDLSRNKVTDDHRRDLMGFLKERLQAGPALPYNPDERLAG